MISPRFKAYIDDTIAFTRSLVIKSEATIAAQNNELTLLGYTVDDLDPTGWKYYLNLAGIPHPADTPIYITSSDTHANIMLTSAVLATHPVTAREYGPGGPYHSELLRRYPKRIDYILRTFNPVDIHTAIDAADFTLLYYATTYVASRELIIIRRLQEWILSFQSRWDVQSFKLTDALYPASFLAVMYAAIPAALMAIRMEYIKTPQVSDYHLWTYLASHYRLDRFKECLSDKQALYLYRNIKYLRYHAGKEKTIRELLSQIAKPMGVEGLRYDVTQDHRDILISRVPNPLALRTPYTDDESDVSIENRRDIEHCFDLTIEKAKYNAVDYDNDVVKAKNAIASSIIDNIPTGLLELNTVLPYHRAHYSPEQIAINQYFRYVDDHRYVATYLVPFANAGDVRMTVEDITVLLLYCFTALQYNTSIADSMDTHNTIPNVRVSGTISDNVPNATDLSNLFTEDLIQAGFVTSVLEDLVIPTDIYGVEDLVALSNTISFRYFQHVVDATRPFSTTDRSLVWSAINTIYTTYEANVNNGFVTFTDWADTIDVDLSALSDTELLNIIEFIMREVIGVNDHIGLDKCRNSAVEILRLLTNYGIIFVDGNADNYKRPLQLGHVFPVDTALSMDYMYYLDNGIYGLDAGSGITDARDLEYPNLTLTPDGIDTYNTDLDMGLELTYETFIDSPHLLDLGLTPGESTVTITET